MSDFRTGDKVVWNYETAEFFPRKVPTPATIVGKFEGCDGFFTITLDSNGEQRVLHQSWLSRR